MLNEYYEKLVKVNDQACFLLGYMKGLVESLDNRNFDYLSKEEAQEKVISALRDQLKILEDVINYE